MFIVGDKVGSLHVQVIVLMLTHSAKARCEPVLAVKFVHPGLHMVR
jgi:hypothetical protein